MSLRGLVLMKNRKARFKKFNPRHTHIKWKGGLYVVDPICVAPVNEKDIVRGSEIIWFEGNPSPIGPDGITDKSGAFLGELVVKNTLDQTSVGPRIDIGLFRDFFSFLGKPVNWVYIMMVGAIVYGLIVGLLEGGVV